LDRYSAPFLVPDEFHHGLLLLEPELDLLLLLKDIRRGRGGLDLFTLFLLTIRTLRLPSTILGGFFLLGGGKISGVIKRLPKRDIEKNINIFLLILAPLLKIDANLMPENI
jgi:hypothetical protein